MKETKRALVVSGLSLFICFVLISGMTFAWFTDSVWNTGNYITAGTLAVDLLMDEAENGTYVSIVDSEKMIFSDAEGGNGHNWEPGKTEIVFLAVRNNGQLDLTYNIDLDITGELAQTLEYALIPDMKAENFTAETWDALKKSGDSSGVVGEDISFSEDKTIAAGETEGMSYFALAIHMKDDAKTTVRGKSADVSLTVNAEQLTDDGNMIQP